jgi:hypothetical protein
VSPASSSAPQLAVGPASAVTGSSATVAGEVTGVSVPTDVSFVVSESGVFDAGDWYSQGTVNADADLSADLSLLSAGRTYAVWLVADGSFGRVTSAPFSFTVADVPQRPTAPVGTPAHARNAVRVSWLAVSGNGMPVTSYRVTAQPGGRTCVAAAPTTTCDVPGLAGSGPYTFQVSATNAVGSSLRSAHSVGVNPNLKGVGVRVVAKRSVRRGARLRVGVRVPGGYDGVAVVRHGPRRLCVATVRRGAGSCVGRVRLAGRRPLAVLFRGRGADQGVTGSALSVLVSRPRSRVRVRNLCALPGPVGVRIRTLSTWRCGGSR